MRKKCILFIKTVIFLVLLAAVLLCAVLLTERKESHKKYSDFFKVADQLDVLFLPQQADDTLARHRLVVHHHRPDLVHAAPSASSSASLASRAGSSIGISMATASPPSGGRVTVNR